MLRNATAGNLSPKTLNREKESSSKVKTTTMAADGKNDQISGNQPIVQKEKKDKENGTDKNSGDTDNDGKLMKGAVETSKMPGSSPERGSARNLIVDTGGAGGGGENQNIEVPVEETKIRHDTVPKDQFDKTESKSDADDLRGGKGFETAAISDDTVEDLESQKKKTEGTKRVNFIETDDGGKGEMKTLTGELGATDAKRAAGAEMDEISKELLRLGKMFEAAKMRIVANEKGQVENISKLAALVMEYRMTHIEDLKKKDKEATILKREIAHTANASKNREADLSAQLEKQKQEIEDLKKENGLNRERLEEKKRVILGLGDQVAASKEKEKNLTDQLDCQRNAKSKALSDVESTNKQLQQREMELSALQLETANLREELRMTKVKDVERWKSKVDHLNRVISELDVAKKEVEERDVKVKKVKEELRVATDSFKEASEGREALSVKMKEMKTERRELESQLKDISQKLKESRKGEEKQKSKEEGLVKVIGIAEGMVRDKEVKNKSLSEELAASRQREQALNDRLGEVNQMVYSLAKADNEHKEVEEQLRAEVGDSKKRLGEARLSQVSLTQRVAACMYLWLFL